jgi:phosphohistidine phosphatase SixA
MQSKEEFIKRRYFILVSATCLALPARASALADALRQGGVLLLRHASTEPGIGDPGGFRLGQCHTQRNLSEQGRKQSQDIGAWFRKHGLQPTAVRSSQWCRCQDTARLAFGEYQDWSALNSTFAGQGNHTEQMRVLRTALQQLPAQALEVWVTHQVIVTGLTKAYPAMGEGFAINARGELRARGMMNDGY